MDPEQPAIEQRAIQDTNDMLIDEQDDDPELMELGLNHQPSFRNQQAVPLPIVAQQIGGASKTIENNIEKINNYQIISRLGNGAFAQVKKVKINDQFYAMKIYSLMKLKKQKFFACDHSFADYGEMFQNEIEILKRLKHQNVALCKEILYGSNYAYVVMELCDFGQIMYFSEQKNNFLRNQHVISYMVKKYNINENIIQNVTKLIFLQVALGLEYLHDHNISNRDIKVENILCRSTNEHLNDIKIADFTTIRYSNDDISYFPCGTAGFQGPQIQNVSEGYSCKSLDVWSFGVCLYTFYYENFPFMAESQYLIEIRSAGEQLKFDENCPKWLIEIVTKTTEKSYKKRASIKDVLQIFRQIQ